MRTGEVEEAQVGFWKRCIRWLSPTTTFVSRNTCELEG